MNIFNLFFNRNLKSNSSADLSDLSSLASTSLRSNSPFPNWRINYKPTPKTPKSKGIWDGYETQDDFISMHLR